MYVCTHICWYKFAFYKATSRLNNINTLSSVVWRISNDNYYSSRKNIDRFHTIVVSDIQMSPTLSYRNKHENR